MLLVGLGSFRAPERIAAIHPDPALRQSRREWQLRVSKNAEPSGHRPCRRGVKLSPRQARRSRRFVTRYIWQRDRAPPRVPRTVREPLDSHGSRCFGHCHDKAASGQRALNCGANPPKPVSRPFGLPPQPLELAAHPAILPDQACQLR
jgi:hypothetical protein